MLCVSRAVLSVVLGAWSVRFVGWADWVDCSCFLSFVFLGVARRLELSPCNTVGHDQGGLQARERGLRFVDVAATWRDAQLSNLLRGFQQAVQDRQRRTTIRVSTNTK